MMERHPVIPGCPGNQGQPFGGLRPQSHSSKSDGLSLIHI